MSQKIIITTSPWKDYKNNKWMLSAFMSIQLDAGVNSKLSAFPDIIQWIDRLQQAKFFVQWNSDKPKDITPLSAKWDKALYEKLFHGNIQVKTFNPTPVSALSIKSYPAIHINDFILTTYQEVGNLKSDELPTTKFYTKDFTRLQPTSQVQLQQTRPVTGRNVSTNDFLRKGHVGKSTVKQQVKKEKALGFSKTPNANLDFGQFHNYHSQIDKTVFKHPSVIKKPEFEYHDVLGIITSYPSIMRKLGLVIDFELGSAPPAASGTVRILPANLSFTGDVDTSCPATAFQYTGKGFYTASKAGSFIDKGVLKLNTEDFSVVQIDVDGAAMKLSSHADAVNYRVAKTLVTQSNYIKPVMDYQRMRRVNPNVNLSPVVNQANNNDNDDDDDPEEGLPPLRSAGIGIVKNGLAESLVKKLTRNMELYKVMISPTALLSGAALFNKNLAPGAGNTNPAAGVGGVTKISAARLTEIGTAIQQPNLVPAVTEVLYADDLVFGYRFDVAYEDKPGTWYSLHKRKNNYSFSPVGGTPQPITLGNDDIIDEGCIHLALTEDENDDEKDNKVNEVMARWEGWSLSVPKLGKGINNEGGPGKEVSSDEDEKKKYQLDNDTPFRLQVNTLPAPRTLPMLRFGNRYRVKVRTVDIAGNGLPHDVAPENETVSIRANIKYLRYEPLPSPVLVQGDEVTGGDKKKMRDRDGESIQHLVIRSNVDVDTKTYEQNNITTIVIDGKAAGTLTYLEEAVRFVKPPRTSQYMAELHGMFDDAIGNPTKAKEAYNFIKDHDKEVTDTGKLKADVIPQNTNPLNITLDYLADPMAAGVIFTMKSDTTFETSWKKGVSRKFSFYFDEEANDTNAGKPYSAQAWRTPRSLKIRLIEGLGEPVWKDRVLTILLPKSAQVEVNYACFWRPDDLDKVSGMMTRISTGSAASRVTQHARKGVHWMFSPWRTLRLVHAVQQPLVKPVLEKSATVSRKDFDDTFARISTVITLHGASTDKIDVNADWKQWIDDIDDPTGPKQVTGKTHVATIPAEYDDKKMNLLNAGGPMIVTPDMLPALKHSFNDTKHRMVNYTPVATTRYREYFTGIIDTNKLAGKQLPLTQVGDALPVNILSSAKPVVPVIAYTVPSFNWMRDDKGSTVSHLRTANIRVYMKRPWYSSGDDERLAVILPPKDAPYPSRNKVLEKYCTIWGKDPAYISGDLNNQNFPQIDHFPFGIQRTDPKMANEEEAVKAACIYDTVKIDDSVTVQVAAYKVLYDAEKQMYYADIPIFVGFAYFPFIKLSLARYQRNSVRKDGKDCCLSSMVEAEWMQVLPARATAVSFSGGKNSFTVALKGVAPFTSNPDKFGAANNNAKVRINITVEDAKFAKTEEAFISINDRTTRTFIWGKDVNLTLQEIRNGQIDFAQKVDIPAEWASKPFRVVIREYELHEFDPIRAQAKAFTNANEYHEYADRLVFMDVFEVNGSV
jgi:hypothetical protein